MNNITVSRLNRQLDSQAKKFTPPQYNHPLNKPETVSILLFRYDLSPLSFRYDLSPLSSAVFSTSHILFSSDLRSYSSYLILVSTVFSIWNKSSSIP